MAELIDLGWDQGWIDRWAAAVAAGPELSDLAMARVATEHRGAVEVVDGEGTFWAEPTGKMFFTAGDKRALPIVGDWVAVAGADHARATGSRAALHAILPRRSFIVRRAAGDREEPQPSAANVDVAFVVTSANQDLNPRRLERSLVTIRDGGARPVIVLNKTDLAAIAAPAILELQAVAGDAPVIHTSALRGWGLDQLQALLARGHTAVVVGSSGVGKSTIISALTSHTLALPSAAVRAHDDRGKHTTTRRELYLLASGGMIIDTPGMRELQLWDPSEDETLASFADIGALAASCRFSDCHHRREPGCAVRAAITAGTLAAARLAAFQKLASERTIRRRRR
jgi:ribosome biogenesis GTPase